MDNLLACDNDPNLVTFRIGSSPPPHWHLEVLPTVPSDVNDNAITVLAFVRTGNSMLSSHDQSTPTTPAVVAVAAATTLSPDTSSPPLVLTLSLRLQRRGENDERMFKEYWHDVEFFFLWIQKDTTPFCGFCGANLSNLGRYVEFWTARELRKAVQVSLTGFGQLLQYQLHERKHSYSVDVVELPTTLQVLT